MDPEIEQRMGRLRSLVMANTIDQEELTKKVEELEKISVQLKIDLEKITAVKTSEWVIKLKVLEIEHNDKALEEMNKYLETCKKEMQEYVDEVNGYIALLEDTPEPEPEPQPEPQPEPEPEHEQE